jgi:hypothetical protein
VLTRSRFGHLNSASRFITPTRAVAQGPNIAWLWDAATECFSATALGSPGATADPALRLMQGAWIGEGHTSCSTPAAGKSVGLVQRWNRSGLDGPGRFAAAHDQPVNVEAYLATSPAQTHASRLRHQIAKANTDRPIPVNDVAASIYLLFRSL